MSLHRFSDPSVKAVFESYPQQMREALEDLREMILNIGDAMQGVGPLEESLKWGQPSYRSSRSGVGTAIRIGTQAAGTEFGLFVHCQTTLIEDFKALYGDRLRYSDNRGVIFTAGEVPPMEPLKHCIALALTYGQRSDPIVRPARRPRTAVRALASQST
jgi:hypothetical protein